MNRRRIFFSGEYPGLKSRQDMKEVRTRGRVIYFSWYEDNV